MWVLTNNTLKNRRKVKSWEGKGVPVLDVPLLCLLLVLGGDPGHRRLVEWSHQCSAIHAKSLVLHSNPLINCKQKCAKKKWHSGTVHRDLFNLNLKKTKDFFLSMHCGASDSVSSPHSPWRCVPDKCTDMDAEICPVCPSTRCTASAPAPSTNAAINGGCYRGTDFLRQFLIDRYDIGHAKKKIVWKSETGVRTSMTPSTQRSSVIFFPTWSMLPLTKPMYCLPKTPPLPVTLCLFYAIMSFSLFLPDTYTQAVKINLKMLEPPQKTTQIIYTHVASYIMMLCRTNTTTPYWVNPRT